MICKTNNSKDKLFLSPKKRRDKNCVCISLDVTEILQQSMDSMGLLIGFNHIFY